MTHESDDVSLRRRHLGLAAAGVVLGRAAHAEQPWPARPIRIVVPWPPGGPVDRYTRAMAQALSAQLGQPLVIDNRAGAGGLVGTEYVSKARPDGYTLLGTNTTAFVGNVVASPEVVRFDPARDFTPLAIYQEGAAVIVAHPSFGVRSFEEFVAAARDAQDPVPYASSGPGSTATLSLRLMEQRYGIKVLDVQYRGGGPRLAALLAGEVKFALFDIGIVRDLVRDGRLVPLIGVGQTRNAVWPDLPSFGDVGLEGMDFSDWHALFAPAGLPDAVLARLQRALEAASRDPAYRNVIEEGGGRAVLETGGDAKARLDRNFADFQRLLG